VTHRLAGEGLTKRYRRRAVLREVSLEVHTGEIVGLMGRNGAGKTTTFYMLVGLVRCDGGQVVLDGVDMTRWPMYRRARAGVAYLAQERSVFRKLSVEDNLKLVLEMSRWPRQRQRERLETVLERFGPADDRRVPAIALSGGQQRRLEVARAIVLEPAFLLLDEPFSGVDPITIAEIKRMLTELAAAGTGIFLTDHNVRDTLSTTHRAYVIHEGAVIARGTPEEILADPNARRCYLGDGASGRWVGARGDASDAPVPENHGRA